MGKITESSSEFLLSSPLLFFQNVEENGLMFRTLYIVKRGHSGFFFHLYLRTLIFFKCFLHGPYEREDALHTSALHQHLTKCEMKGLLYTETNVSESTR